MFASGLEPERLESSQVGFKALIKEASMRITQDLRANEILRLEHLLEGFNYSVWVNTYGPFDLDRTLEEQLAFSTGNEVIIGGQSCVTASELALRLPGNCCTRGMAVTAHWIWMQNAPKS